MTDSARQLAEFLKALTPEEWAEAFPKPYLPPLGSDVTDADLDLTRDDYLNGIEIPADELADNYVGTVVEPTADEIIEAEQEICGYLEGEASVVMVEWDDGARSWQDDESIVKYRVSAPMKQVG